MRDKHQIIEEPDEVKASRPVLKTNGVGDNLVEFNNPEAKWVDWNKENIKTLTLAYKEVPESQERVNMLLDWLESSVENFNEILKLWNTYLVPKS